MTKISFIQKYLKGNRIYLVLMILLGVISVFFSLLHPLVFSFFIDNVINKQPIENEFLNHLVISIGGIETIQNHLWIAGAVIIFVYVMSSLALYFRGYLSGLISENMVYHIRNDLYNHLQKLPYSYHVKVKTGELVQKCTSDVEQIRKVMGNQLQQIIRSISIIIIASVLLWRIHPSLTIKSICLMPIVLVYSLYFYERSQKAFMDSDDAEARLTTMIQENLSGIRVVKAFGKEKYESDRFDEDNQNYRDLTFHMEHLLGQYWSSSDILCMLQIVIVLYFGIIEAQNGNLSIGNFFVFISYISMILWPVRQLGRILADIGKSSVAINRLVEIFNEKEEDTESGITPNLKGEITLTNVSFQYDDASTPTLKDINMHIQSGSTVAIIGPTGSGKSSLVHLLTGLYDYSSGSILLDTYELRDIQKEYLRSKVGIVLQEPFLFSKSIYENIHLSSDGYSTKDVERAAKIAHIHDVIYSFKDGYETLVGEKGVTLSGGQKQRIAIARTIMKDNKILIFDDSLSAVDTETDASIRSSLNKLQEDVTKIIITQRINSAKDADYIYVIENGTITASGTHDELIHQDGLYKRIYEIQSSYVEEVE